MSLHQDIKNGIKQAMLAKDELRLSVLRGLSADFTNDVISKKRKPDELLTDDEAMTIIKKAAKRRMDSIEQFKKGGREDLAKDETAELQILKTFIPLGLGRDEIKKIALAKKEEFLITDKSKIGLLMSHVMKELKGKADGGDVKAVVEEILG